MAKVIALRNGQAEMAIPFDWENEVKQTNDLGEKDPCEGCTLREWCGDDDCAQKWYPIDAPYTIFPNLEVFIQFKKQQGWL